MSESILTPTLIIHATSGFFALVAGMISIIAKKGRRLHNVSGLMYFWAMMGVIVTSFVITAIRDNQFLFFIGLFTLTMVVAGYRSILHKSLKPLFLDWVIWILGLITAIAMALTGDLILVVFGVLLFLNVFNDTRIYYKIYRGQPLHKLEWLRRHVSMMMGGYIATLTAFIVQNVHYDALPWLPWLMPTFILTPVIIYWSRRVRQGKMELVG